MCFNFFLISETLNTPLFIQASIKIFRQKARKLITYVKNSPFYVSICTYYNYNLYCQTFDTCHAFFLLNTHRSLFIHICQHE